MSSIIRRYSQIVINEYGLNKPLQLYQDQRRAAQRLGRISHFRLESRAQRNLGFGATFSAHLTSPPQLQVFHAQCLQLLRCNLARPGLPPSASSRGSSQVADVLPRTRTRLGSFPSSPSARSIPSHPKAGHPPSHIFFPQHRHVLPGGTPFSIHSLFIGTCPLPSHTTLSNHPSFIHTTAYLDSLRPRPYRIHSFASDRASPQLR